MQEYYLSHGLMIPDALIAATAIDFDALLAKAEEIHNESLSGWLFS
ncbi:MAG: hypothetical protein QNJ42_02510 [Crocosphaera sp.]|nr:hypothetical protein [Crocosphaera sp.]